MIQSAGMQQSPDGLSLDPGGYQQPLYLQQEHSMQAINVRFLNLYETRVTFGAHVINILLIVNNCKFHSQENDGISPS
ncbi:hypothetical protein M0802_003743 [Mischocyttarus mexicanus]|nr:hypothetical protein M0802_003743 [Mischocyttarus mexicanus]